MTESLKSKQQVPLSHEERQLLIDESRERGMTPGLLARALLLYGLDHMDSEPKIGEQIESEKFATKLRISDGARVAAQQRWATNQKGTKK